MAGKLMLNPWVYGKRGRGRQRNPEDWEVLTPAEEKDLYDLWDTSRVPTSKSYPTSGAKQYARRVWSADWMAKRHPSRSRTAYYKIYERRGMNPQRGKRKSRRRVPGMLKAPKWRLYRGRRRKHNLRWRTYRGEQLRTGTHRARRHALEAMRSGDPWTAKRYLGLEERLMARRRTLGLNPRQRRSNRVIARWRSDLGDRFVDLHQDKGRYRYQWSGEESPQVMSPMLYRDEDAVRAVEAGPVTIMGHFGHRLKRSYRYNRGRGAR